MEKQTQVRLPAETTRQLQAIQELMGDPTTVMTLARCVERVYYVTLLLQANQEGDATPFTQYSLFNAIYIKEDVTQREDDV